MNKIIMRQARQFQEKLEKAKQELEKETVEASSGGGAVTVVMTGQQQVKSVKISPEAVDDVEMLEDLIVAAAKEARRMAEELAAERMWDFAKVLGLPLT